jgi:hypothetical protein
MKIKIALIWSIPPDSKKGIFSTPFYWKKDEKVMELALQGHTRITVMPGHHFLVK